MNRFRLTLAWLLLTAAAHAAPPNIIFLLADDLRYDALGCNGNSLAQTPNLDQMARDGVRFDHFFVTTPICTVSRASILTGLHGRCHGIVGFRDDFRAEMQPFGYPFQLRQAGYWTAFAGKWGVGRTVPEGWFDHFEGFWGQGHYFEPGNPEHLDSRLAAKAIEFMDAAPKGKPFCVSISFKSPHPDDPVLYPPDPGFAKLYSDVTFPCGPLCDDKYFNALPPFVQTSLGRQQWLKNCAPPGHDPDELRREYHRLVASMDAAVGRIRAALAERGLTGNTVVIFASDNGELLGERGLKGKWLLYESSIKVPLIVCGAAVAAGQRGSVVHDMALNIDCAPTLLDLAGAKPLPAWQGRSWKPLLAGATAEPLRTGAFFEHTYMPSEIPASRGLRSLNTKCILYTDHGVSQRFDLKMDPTELTDTMPKEGPVRIRLEAAVNAYANALNGWKAAPDTPWLEPFDISDALLELRAN